MEARKTSRPVERRFTSGNVEVRKSGSKRTIEGYAAVFDTYSQNLGGFIETIERSAFSKTVQEADVRALYNHDENFVLGRNKSGTLDLSIDSSGLYYRIDPPDTTYATDLMAIMERGDVTQSSFAFFTVKDNWAEGDNLPIRSLIEVGLVDVSPVVYPAYLDATSGVGRSSFALLSKRSGIPLAEFDDPEVVLRAIRGETPGDPEPHEASTPNRYWELQLEALAAYERDNAEYL